MVKCKNCGQVIDFISLNNRYIPVDSLDDINILPDKARLLTGITSDGLTVKGIQVGDSCDDGYYMAKLKHICRKND